MKLEDIKNYLDAQVICCEDRIDGEVCSACGSDMMSDVLAFVKDQALLLTGLVNEQVVRTAAMMDMKCVVLVRDKKPSAEMIELAIANRIVLMASPLRMYEACGTLYSHGLRG